ncbi:MAG: pilus assembly protein TadG-related protein [Anaerolineales bacterium]|nr:pilus assembly protein TadG-related protein [Anaerolineales bacterium]
MHRPLGAEKTGDRIKKSIHSERGQAIILIVFALIGLIGMTALAVDGGRAFLEKRNVQNVADTTALGGAIARVKGAQSEWAYKTYEIAKANGYDNNGVGNSVEVHSPPNTGVYQDDVDYIQVTITSRVPAYFGKVIGINQMTVSAEAIARTKRAELGEIMDGDALISLAPTSDCENKRAFWIHGESTITVNGGGIFVNSNNPDCALIQNGNGSIRLDEGYDVKVVGGANIQKPKLITPFPILTGRSPRSYPPPFIMPKLGCHKTAEILPDGKTMSSGSWSEKESFPPKGVQYLEAGVYCITDTDFELKGEDSLEGSNVIIKIEGGELRIDGQAKVDLKAPASGDFAGLLFYLPIDNNNLVTLNLGKDASLRGTILAPGAEIRLNGSASEEGFHSQIIGYMIRSDGQSNIVIKYKDEYNFDAYSMPEIQLVK